MLRKLLNFNVQDSKCCCPLGSAAPEESTGLPSHFLSCSPPTSFQFQHQNSSQHSQFYKNPLSQNGPQEARKQNITKIPYLPHEIIIQIIKALITREIHKAIVIPASHPVTKTLLALLTTCILAHPVAVHLLYTHLRVS